MTVSCPAPSVLFELHDTPADFPISRGHQRVYAAGSNSSYLQPVSRHYCAGVHDDETSGIVADNERHLPTKRIIASRAFRTPPRERLDLRFL